MFELAQLVPAWITGAVCGLIAWGGVRRDLRYLRRDVDAAHDRLDQIEAPSARVSALPDV